MTTPIVLVHGGGFDRRSWDLLLPHLDSPAIAVDLPGRGSHPAPLADVTFAACAEAVVADVAAAGFDDVVLVGHSLAGCSMPSVVARLAGRVRHAVFVACTVPEDGRSAYDTLDPGIQAAISAADAQEPRVMDGDIARVVLGDDLDDAQLAWCTERLVPEAPGLTTEPVDLAPLQGLTSTWVRTMRDLIVPPDRQERFARNVGDCGVVDLDAGHMCMVGRPRELARLLDAVAR